MRLGMFMMPVHPPDRTFWGTLDEDTEKSLLADQLGFDELWLGEHFSASTEPIPSPLDVLFQPPAPDQAHHVRHRGHQHPEPSSGHRRRRMRAVRSHEPRPVHAGRRTWRTHLGLRTVQAHRSRRAQPHGGRGGGHDPPDLDAGSALRAQRRVLGYLDQGRHQRQARRRLHAEALPAARGPAGVHLAGKPELVVGENRGGHKAGA